MNKWKKIVLIIFLIAIGITAIVMGAKCIDNGADYYYFNSIAYGEEEFAIADMVHSVLYGIGGILIVSGLLVFVVALKTMYTSNEDDKKE